MKKYFLYLLLLCCSLTYAQHHFKRTVSISSKHFKENAAHIRSILGPEQKNTSALVWTRQGPGYYYRLKISPKKIQLRYTGKNVQLQRKLKQLIGAMK